MEGGEAVGEGGGEGEGEVVEGGGGGVILFSLVWEMIEDTMGFTKRMMGWEDGIGSKTRSRRRDETRRDEAAIKLPRYRRVLFQYHASAKSAVPSVGSPTSSTTRPDQLRVINTWATGERALLALASD